MIIRLKNYMYLEKNGTLEIKKSFNAQVKEYIRHKHKILQARKQI